MKFARPINDTSPNITQAFGTAHRGTDYGYPDGTPIYASQSGTVVLMKKGETRQWIANTASDPFPHPRPLITDDYGNLVKIDHGGGYETLYAHQRPNSITVSTGQSVKQGQQIGAVGSTGNSTGHHLHWEVRKGGVVIDPTPLMDTTFTSYGTTGGEQPVSNTIADQSDAFIALCTELGVDPKKDKALDKVRSLKKETEDVKNLRGQVEINENFRKQISKLLINSEDLEWQKVFEEIDKTIKEHDDSLAKARLSLELWDAINEKVGGDFVYPVQVPEIKKALDDFKTKACKELKDYDWKVLLVQAFHNFGKLPEDQK